MGIVDNVGLIIVLVFVEFKMQVNNSVVGINLIINFNFLFGLNYWYINLGDKKDCKVIVIIDFDGDICIYIIGIGNVCGLYCSLVLFN